MATALDYSAGRPAGAAVRAAGHVGVVRYAGTPWRPKNITKAEFQDMDRNGVGVALIFEDLSGDALKGWGRGVDAARAIAADAANIGFPASRPLYFAVDQDITTQMETVKAYFGGIASVLGSRPIGVYGEADVLDAVIGAGLAEYGWQTAAWSKGRRTTKARLFQRIGSVVVGGIACDVNDILAADWGQHNAQGDDMTPQEFLDTKVTWWDGHAVPMKDILAEVFIAARGLNGQPAFADQKTPVVIPPVASIDAKVAGLSAAVAALSSQPDLTVDQVRQIVTDAVKQNIQITGEVHIGPAA
ncbi:glycoside hydrolase domain-containing protein [Amycolatopsis sp. NPDC004625]|uniref:glycoside hydrolase domain-containing protein n=1 Tax=Amycolatopsis sp. NPDC004625 TaxID=3154670 RepID=UPI0033B8997B